MTRSALPLQSKQGPRQWLRADDVIALERAVSNVLAKSPCMDLLPGARRPKAVLSGPTFVPDVTADAS
jgi:hypothetical protein